MAPRCSDRSLTRVARWFTSVSALYVMEHIPVEEIARAVSGAVTSVLNKIAEESKGGQPSRSASSAASHHGSDSATPSYKKRKQEKGKYVI